jgi:hypothetical protein
VRALALWLLAFGVVPAAAEECLLADATYVERDGQYELRFHPIPEAEKTIGFTNAFTVRIRDSELSIEGTVNAGSSTAQPWGEWFLECQPGDAPAQCRIWEGVVYEVDDGKIDFLPGERSRAPGQIFFPSLSGTLYYSQLRELYGIRDFAWEVFDLKGCTG